MSSDSKLDQLVKGQPPPNVSPNQIAQEAKHTTPSASAPISSHLHSSHDPRDSLPSSPPQIYLNLLILESSLRLQYLSLRARLRLHTLLLAALTAWVLVFTWLLFFRPREDGSGVGGSVYWVVETGEKLGWGGGVVTSILFYATGMYERGVRWPTDFVSVTNRGLRTFNIKVVIVRGSLLSELVGWIIFLLSPWRWTATEGKRISFHIVPKDIEATGDQQVHWNTHASKHGLIEEDTAPGGDVLKLLLLPKPFSPDFREGWENYRAEYWGKENERRAELRRLIALRKREVSKKEGGWLWWAGWRGWRHVQLLGSGKTRRQRELEHLALREKPSAERMRLLDRERALRRRGEGVLRSESTHSHSRSRTSSRASTPGPDGIEAGKRSRRGSSNQGSMRRPRKVSSMTSQGSRLSATETILQADEPSGDEKTSGSNTNGQSGGDHQQQAPGPVRKSDLQMSRMTPEIKQEPDEA
ncbi:hypothetical protein K431DRAFT_220901 [Polychaeton citri CBS 116435]|uniref:Spo7-domain-containing protein n=1 Tax=Polychaeton citri CBS 116435 TaxID=1314669 RepID=A0A9P4URL5_9PEZI|nr:hypothetical protein K431DRAFT_220901 [Polychaeton citri CBS 116435]